MKALSEVYFFENFSTFSHLLKQYVLVIEGKCLKAEVMIMTLYFSTVKGSQSLS